MSSTDDNQVERFSGSGWKGHFVIISIGSGVESEESVDETGMSVEESVQGSVEESRVDVVCGIEEKESVVLFGDVEREEGFVEESITLMWLEVEDEV